ncbi:MAG: hypothetical protein EBR82_68600, partial [Caulobacteraceae bacterium]|nr:hypothetical protein [Caulobacteraceae bacterium]
MDSNVFPAGFAPQDQQEQFPDYETESAALAVPPHEPDQHDSNLAVFLTEDQLSSIAHELVEGYEVDLASRKGWEESFINAIDLLGFNPVDKTEPWPGACSAVHPLLAEQAINFQSKAIQELYPAGGPVRTQIVGKTDGEKEKRAQRVKDFMNYQITKTMPEYYPDTDRMLLYLPLNGSAFKKVY